jgi:Ca2+:H+ antiporter
MGGWARPSVYWLFVFVPVTLLVEHAPGVTPAVVFFSAALSIVPIAYLISRSTEGLAHYTGDAIGGLLNATFGNLPELIIATVALKAGLYEMVAGSLVGAILANLLLAVGLSFLLGGLRWHTQEFSAAALSMYGSMMFIAVVSLTLPSMYERTFAVSGPIVEQQYANVGLAALLLVLYALYLVFMIGTHPEAFASVGKGGGEEEHGPRWSLARCTGSLVAASVLAALMSEVLVGAAEGTGQSLGLSAPFIGVVLLATVGGAAEGASAVGMALKNRLDLTLGIAFGSCIQIALFVAPLLVFASYLVGPRPFLLSFSAGGVGLVFLAVLIATFISSRGSANWYKGVQLVAVYAMIALMLYFAPI